MDLVGLFAALAWAQLPHQALHLKKRDVIGLDPRQVFKLALVAFLLATSPALAETVTGTPRIVDGDTLEISGTMIRLHGVDAPEVSQPAGRDTTGIEEYRRTSP